MSVVDLYSKRQKRIRGEVPDVYQYETIPEELRVQVIHIWGKAFQIPDRKAFGVYYPESTTKIYKFIHETLCDAYGCFKLAKNTEHSFDVQDCNYAALCSFLLESQETDKVIDVIELSFRLIDTAVRDNPSQFYGSSISPDKAIDRLNHRFREHGVGYQYESGQIIKVDSEFIHSEVMEPALKMLSNPMYKGANDEFMSAHKHYRAGDNKECVNDCLKTFESCLKSICDKRRWEYDKERHTATQLIQTVFDKGLIPAFMQSHFSGLISGLRTTLESGVPTVRNKFAAHGQGSQIAMVPEYIAAYVLHLTAANILLLARAEAESWEEFKKSIPF